MVNKAQNSISHRFTVLNTSFHTSSQLYTAVNHSRQHISAKLNIKNRTNYKSKLKTKIITKITSLLKTLQSSIQSHTTDRQITLHSTIVQTFSPNHYQSNFITTEQTLIKGSNNMSHSSRADNNI